MNKESEKLKELKKDKKESYIDLAYMIVGLLFFPLFGLIFSICLIIIDLSNIHTTNKQIKEQKIKDILGDVIIIRDKNGYIKDIKL